MSTWLNLSTNDFIMRYNPTVQQLISSHALCVKSGLQKKQNQPKNVLSFSLIQKAKNKQRPYLAAALPINKKRV